MAKTQVYKLFILTIPFTQMHIHTQCTCIHRFRDAYTEVFVTKGKKNYKWSISNNQGLSKRWYIQKQWNVKKPFQRMRQISNGIKKASMIFIKKASLRTVYEIYRYTCLCIFPQKLKIQKAIFKPSTIVNFNIITLNIFNISVWKLSLNQFSSKINSLHTFALLVF